MTSQPSLFPTSQLPKRQAFLYGYAAIETDAASAGKALHEYLGCDYCQPGKPCAYAEKNGREVLEALKRKGLVRRDIHHVYRRVEQPSSQMSEDVDWKGF